MCHPTVATVALLQRQAPLLDYAIPPQLQGKIAPGMAVMAPLRGQPQRAIVWQLQHRSRHCLQPLLQLDEQLPPLGAELLRLAEWIAFYYLCPLPKVLQLFLPPLVEPRCPLWVMASASSAKLRAAAKALQARAPQQAALCTLLLQQSGPILAAQLLQKGSFSYHLLHAVEGRGLLRTFRSQGEPALQTATYLPAPAKRLRGEQLQAKAAIVQQLEQEQFQTLLLHGATGSGKTEVYMQCIAATLGQQKTVLMLTPEIALIPQLLERLTARLQLEIGVLHHRLPAGARLHTWKRIAAGEIRLVLGTRSAIFSPLPRLGLIIVDEEHAAAYKQSEKMPCYHARDLAVIRGKITSAVVVLGSATPSLESYANAQKKKYILLALKQRIQRQRPQFTCIDMQAEMAKSKGSPFSSYLLQALEQRLQRKEQSLLFLNRRGYYTAQICPHCNQAVQCPHCTLALTYHLSRQQLACHLCGHAQSKPRCCPACGTAAALSARGYGTEKVERLLHAIFPQVRTLRIDHDTTRQRESHAALLKQFRAGKADVLIGTQMIAKGLDFPCLTLAAILNADAGLQIPDFRAAENTFHLIMQVAGRAGRAFLPGEVIIQTQMPHHPLIRFACAQDYAQFCRYELHNRQQLLFPPYRRLIKCTLTARDRQQLERYSQQLYQALQRGLPARGKLFPPIPCGYAKINDRYRQQILLQTGHILALLPPLQKVLEGLPLALRRHLCVDIDPASTFF